MPRLRRVNCSGPGILRRRRGRGFEFYDSSTGEKISDRETLARIRALAIPPAWKDVWICSSPVGHLQAMGIDAAGRKQYLYHDEWRKRRDAEKFDNMLDFARTLPRLRAVCLDDLRETGLTHRRVLACAVRLLDRGFFRVGTEDYAEENDSYGLATIKKRHVTLERDEMVFDYRAKGGKRLIQTIVDPDIHAVVAALKRRRTGGDELLAYKSGRSWVDVRSTDINVYIKEATGGDFTAKDFRTWNATVLAAVALAVSGSAAKSPSAQKRAMTRAVKEVAHYLHNTPAVCRASYIDPRVFDRYTSGWNIKLTLDALGVHAYGEPSTQGPIEEAVLDLLEERHDAETIERVDALENIA